MKERFVSHTLPNGLQVVIERMEGVRSAAAGFLCRTGGRDEAADIAGVSHFLEHMCFKGTPSRSAAQINLDFDRIGGQPNAFTTHDRTCYHGITRASDVEMQMEILADMMRSTLPVDEFDTEKKVVLDEIALYRDRIEHVALDLTIEKVFEGHSLGRPVLGYERTVKPLTRQRMHEYFQSRYCAGNMILVVAGGVDPGRIIEMARRYCGHWERGDGGPPSAAPEIRYGQTAKKIDRFNQQVVTITFARPRAGDALHETAEAVAAILGGANSRLYWSIEQAGLCPHVGAYRMDFSDCGLLILFAQCDPENTEKVIDAIRTETGKMTQGPVTDAELQRVKNKRRTALAVDGESPHHRLLQVIDDVNYRGQPRTVEERLAAVEAINRDSIRGYFERYPIDGEGCLVTVGPRDLSLAD